MINDIKSIVADILAVDIDVIKNDTSPENLGVWDSLKQMNIVVALEEEFDITLADDDVIEMLNFELICAIMQRKLAVK